MFFNPGRIGFYLRPAPGSGGLQVLGDAAPEQIAPYLLHEHPQTIALCLSQLSPGVAAGVLRCFPTRLQADVAYRMTTLGEINPAVLKQLEEGMEAPLSDVLSGNQDVGGPKVLADVLNMSGSRVEKNVLDQIDAQDPEVSESVRNLMFVFADLIKLTDRELQVVLQEADEKDLVIAMKACGEPLRQRLLDNFSEEKRAFIATEMEKLGPMRLSETEKMQLRIMQTVRKVEAEGKLTIVRGDTDETWI